MSRTNTNYSDNSVISISKDSLEVATDVLARAFEGDPLIRYFLSGHEKDYLEGVRRIFEYQCLMYIEMELPIFGTVKNHQITGIACLSVPEKKDRPDSLIEADRQFEEFMGPDSFDRIKRYMKLNNKNTPRKSHHYLAALGVHPNFQGQGFGRLLLDRVSEMALDHGVSTGVFLETAKTKNVEMYNHFGYNLLATEKLDGIVKLSYMFKPVKKNN